MLPEDLLHFVESSEFTASWEDLGLSVDEDLLALQMTIMTSPKRAPVIAGTGGLRKLRFAPASWRTGKRGAARVCYVYFEEFGIVYLVLVYGKGEKDDLSPGEKRSIRRFIENIQKHLERRKIID